MFGFIKNLIKPKSFKEVKQEYKKVPVPNLRKPKANWIVKAEDLEGLENVFKANAIIGEILDCCYRGLRPDQEDCPPLIIHNYKKLLEIADEGALDRATTYIFMYLSEQQQQDFRNKVSQLKEYKEWKEKQRLDILNEDFE